MSENLVIVESPAKAKTIGKFLGGGYKVIASNGHVRDLPKSQLGVDVEHNFTPKYITLREMCWNAFGKKRKTRRPFILRRTRIWRARRSLGTSHRSSSWI